MPQVRRRGDLAQEAVRPQHGGQLGTQHLHGDFPAMLEILGLVHRGHAALSQLPLDPVAVAEGGLKPRKGVGQVGLCRVVELEDDSVCGERLVGRALFGQSHLIPCLPLRETERGNARRKSPLPASSAGLP
jgi:hypothetical protein